MKLKNRKAKFLECELDCNSGQLLLSNKQYNLEPLVFQFLLLLIEHQGEIVSKQSVVEKLWVDKTPTDEALRAMVKKSREALKDDARNPRYIKTIPTKGYVLIPPVELTSTVVKSFLQTHRKLSLASGLLVTFVAISFFWYFLFYTPAPIAENKIVLTKTKIADVSDIEVSTYYINGALKNIAIENNTERNIGQLTIDYVSSMQQQKVVFDTPLFEQFWWSNASQRLLVMRNDFAGFYKLQFYRNQSDPFITLFETPLEANFKVLAFDQQGTSIFMQNINDSSVVLRNLQDGKISQPAMLANLSAWIKSTQIQYRNTGSAELALYPANTSSSIMAILQTGTKTFFTLYESITSDTPAYEFTSSHEIISSVWNENDERFSFTTSSGQLFSFQVDALRLTSWNSGGEKISRIVTDCGADCFVVANTQELPKLSEITNPFNISRLNINANIINEGDYAQLIKTNSINRNESLPVYTDLGLFFVEQSENKVSILFKADTQQTSEQEETIYTFDEQVVIDELVIDNSGDHLAGLANQRPFLLDLNTRKFSYIALNLPLISHLRFDTNNQLQYFGQTIDTPQITLTQNLAAEQIQNEQINEDNAQQLVAGRRTAGLYEYNLSSRQSRLLMANKKVRKIAKINTTIDGIATTINATFTLDTAQNAILTFKDGRADLFLGSLVHDCIGCWQIKDNYFYTLGQSDDKQSFIKRVNLLNGEEQQLPILLDRVLKQFVLHPNSQKLILSTRQDLRTELTQIEGLRQMF